MIPEFPERRYIQAFKLEDIPPYFEQSYDCKLYTVYTSDLCPDVEYYILK